MSRQLKESLAKLTFEDEKTIGYWVSELFYWRYNNSGNFNSYLFDLMMKADTKNKLILANAYPFAAAALELWLNSENKGDDLFKEWGLLL